MMETNGSTDIANGCGALLLVGFVLAIAGMVGSIWFSSTIGAFDTSIQKTGGVVATLFLLAAITERIVEFILTLWRGKRADELDFGTREQDEKINALKAARKIADPQELDKNDEINVALVDLLRLRRERMIYKSISRRNALFLSVSVGLILSMLGIRIFESLMTTTLAPTDIQLIIFRAVDIILTALLIAGGTEGINKMTKAYYGFMGSISKAGK